jgi:hypothetical protein
LNLNSRIEALKDRQTERDEGIIMLAELVSDMFHVPALRGNDRKYGFGARWWAVADKMRWPLREISDEEIKRKNEKYDLLSKEEIPKPPTPKEKARKLKQE